MWIQDFAIAKPYYVPIGRNAMVIPREGIKLIPTELLVVPEDNKLKPNVIEVESDTKKISVAFQPIPQNEAWFWGITPANPCPPPSGPSAMSISVRLIHKSGVYSDFYGAFVWHITLTNEDKYEIPFYFQYEPHGALKLISIAGFNKANDISQALCYAQGRDCEFALETNSQIWGKSHRIIFKENDQFNQNNCPF